MTVSEAIQITLNSFANKNKRIKGGQNPKDFIREDIGFGICKCGNPIELDLASKQYLACSLSAFCPKEMKCIKLEQDLSELEAINKFREFYGKEKIDELQKSNYCQESQEKIEVSGEDLSAFFKLYSDKSSIEDLKNFIRMRKENEIVNN